MDTGKPWNRPAATLAAPEADHLLVGVDLVAAAGGEARGRRDGVRQRHHRDAHRRDQQRHDVASSVQGMPGRGSPCGRAPTVLDPVRGQAEDGGGDGRPGDADEDRRHPSARSGAARAGGPGSRAHREGGRFVWPMSRTKAVTSSTNVSASVEKPNSLGSCPTMMTMARPFMYPTWTSFDSRSATKPSFADPETDLDRPHEQREHPGQGDRGGGVVRRPGDRHDRREDRAATPTSPARARGSGTGP